MIILDSVDAKATKSLGEPGRKKGVKVVAYDRLAEGHISAYVSYDNEKIGQPPGPGACVEALGDKAKDSNVVMINGSPTDPNAAALQEGRPQRPRQQGQEVGYE